MAATERAATAKVGQGILVAARWTAGRIWSVLPRDGAGFRIPMVAPGMVAPSLVGFGHDAEMRSWSPARTAQASHMLVMPVPLGLSALPIAMTIVVG